MMPSQRMNQQSPTDINHYQDMALNLVYNICSIVCAPVEMLLRPQYGTRYFPPIITALTAAMMMLLPLFSSIADMLPFGRFHGIAGLYGIGTLSKLYFTGGFIHGFRIWRRMIHIEREKNSLYEGPPLPIFNMLPGSFWIVRIIYEPIFVIIVALVLSNFFILQSSAVHYLIFAAIMLAMKQYCAWYMQWQFLRELMDMRNAGPIIAKIVDNTVSDDELATIHLASIPKNIPEDLRRDTALHIARAFNVQGDEK